MASTRCQHPISDHRAGVAGGGTRELTYGHGHHFYVQIDTVEQWPRYAAEVLGHHAGPTYTGLLGVIVVATGAGVHRGEQHKRRRILYAELGPRDRHTSLFERLTQHLEHGAFELRQLIQKEHPMVGQGYFARLRMIATPHQRDIRNGMVGRTKRTMCDQAPGGGLEHAPGYRVDLGGLECLVQGERRQDGRDAPREHRLARSRRPDQDGVVPASCGYLEGTFHGLLPTHVGKVGVPGLQGLCKQRTGIYVGWVDMRSAGEHIGCLLEGLDGQHLQPIYDGGFFGTRGWNQYSLVTQPSRFDGNRQCAFDGHYATV